MTLKDLYAKMESKNVKPFSEAEKDLLNSTFKDENVINAFLYTSDEYILNMLRKSNGYIIHENGFINKISPINGENYFGIYKEKDGGFLIAKSIT